MIRVIFFSLTALTLSGCVEGPLVTPNPDFQRYRYDSYGRPGTTVTYYGRFTYGGDRRESNLRRSDDQRYHRFDTGVWPNCYQTNDGKRCR